MSLGTVHIPGWAGDLLGAAYIDANTLDFQETRFDADQFQVIHRIMLAMGARWTPGEKRFTFPAKADVEQTVRHALMNLGDGQQPPPPPEPPAGRWSTPPELAHLLLDHARVGVETTVLDMCAGAGHLTGLCIAMGARTWAVEEDPASVAYLAARMKGLRKLWQVEPGKWVADMTPYTRDRTGPDGRPLPKMAFQAIISHPLHHAQFDIALTRALWPFVAPGGVLATVISADSWGGDHVRCRTFRDWCDEVVADVINIDDQLFHDYGELNHACLFVGIRPTPASLDDDEEGTD